MINIMSSFPITAPCPGCMNGSCAANNGMGLAYPPYYGNPGEMVLQCLPVGQTWGPEYNIIASGYAPYNAHAHPVMFHPQFVPEFQDGYQPYIQSQNQGQWQNTQKGKRGNSKNRFHHKSTGYARISDFPIHPAVESAILFVKANPQASLFSIGGKLLEMRINHL